jgi:hypothetical protein
MSPWVLVGFAAIVALAGASGGLVNTIMVTNRSLLPEGTAEDAGVSTKTSNAGLYVMNIVLGAVAASISWLAYGPYSTLYIIGKGGITPEEYGVTAVSLATAFFIGMGGTKWLQSERDKGRWQAAAADAARADSSPELARNLALASSEQAPQIAARAVERTS